MPSKKQRRRREKTFRHDYGYVTYDEEGNEVQLDTLTELREQKPAKAKAKAEPAKKGRGSRAVREAQPPSWNRSLKRGGLWGGGMLVLSLLFFKNMPIAGRVMLGLVYGIAFIPLTYWIDRTAYRSFLKRSGKTPAA